MPPSQASDADSVVTALTVAHLRSKTHPDGPRVLGIVACPRKELQFRPETIKLLQQAGISPDTLVYSDEVDFRGLFEEGNLSLTLADHNEGSLQHRLGLAECVVEVIDHHEDAGGLTHLAGPVQRRIEFGEAKGFPPQRGLGSACTLVTELYFEEKPELLDRASRVLLGGVILLDTGNCLVESKTTERDVKAAEALFSGAFQRHFNAD